MSFESSRILQPLRDGNITPVTLQAANSFFESAEPAELIEEVAELKPWSMSSFGFQAAALFSAMEDAGQDFPVVFFDTGFEHPETHEYIDTLSRYFALNVTVVEASPEQLAETAREDYFHTDTARFFEIVKHEPYKRFVDEFDARIILGGLRRAQGHGSNTVGARSRTERFQPGPHGTLRIYPLVDVTDEQVRRMYAPGRVPKHPLRDFYLGDRLPLTIEDQNQEKLNCTLNDVPTGFVSAG